MLGEQREEDQAQAGRSGNRALARALQELRRAVVSALSSFECLVVVCARVTGWWHPLSCGCLLCLSLRICMLCICLCFRGRVCGQARHAVERCRCAMATVC